MYKNLIIIILKVVLLSVNESNCVQSPPRIIKDPPYEQLFRVSKSSDEPERPFLLECEAKGEPEPTYRWIKNGLEFNYLDYDNRINRQPGRGTLVFTKPDNVDEGLYQCFAHNKHGVSVSNAVLLRNSELKSLVEEEIQDYYVFKGEPLTIDCNRLTGYPKHMIFWTLQSNNDTFLMANNSRRTVDPEGRLHFSNITNQDRAAIFVCNVTDISRTEHKVGRKTRINVQWSGWSGQERYTPVKQYVSPHSVIAINGQKLELHCIFGGTPLPDIVWSKRKDELEGSQFTFNNYGKSLVINKVSFSDEDTYECTASNGIGTQKSHTMEVTVQSAPFWLEYPNNKYAVEGEEVVFKCLASGVPEPKLQWFVNGVPLEKAPTNSRRKVESPVMTISNLVEEVDTAVYQCNASNIHGYAFKNFYLNVIKSLSPTILQMPDKISQVVVTKTVTMKCRVFGAPKPDVEWQWNGLQLTESHNSTLGNGDLEIRYVLVSDHGEYKCIGINKFGEAEALGELQVKRKTKITHSPEDIEVWVRKMSVFRCNSELDISVNWKIIWKFNCKEIDFDNDPRIVQMRDNSLIITTTEESDSGIYTCVAETDLDKDEMSTSLTVQDVPNSPEILAIECNDLTALVKWQPRGDGRSPILMYSIQFNTSFSPDNWEDAFLNIPAPDTKFKLGLTPWANYTFRVIARNKNGSSEPSAPSEVCQTPEDVPYKNPDNVVGRGTAPDNLFISWTPMPPIEQNGENFFYKVFWKRNDELNAVWNTIEIYDWRESSYTVYSQPSFRQYRVKVEANNRKGQALIQPKEIIGYSGEDKPLQSPQSLRLLQVQDSRSAIIAWDGIQPDSVRGHFRGYKILIWSAGDDVNNLIELSVPPNVTEALIRVFKPYTKNFVQIIAFNDAFNSNASNIITFNTPEGPPGPVQSFEGISMGSNAVYLFWTKPEEPNGILTGYKVFYEKISGTILGPKMERFSPIEDANTTGAKLTGLEPGTKYRVTIHGTTGKGLGDSYYIEVKTKPENSAEPPDRPSFDCYYVKTIEGKKEVRVQWIPNPGNTNPGSYFYVQYRLKGTQEFQNTPKNETQDSTVVHIRGIEEDKAYEIRVIAVDGQYETPSEILEISSSDTINRESHSTANLANFEQWFMMCSLIIVCSI